MAGYPIRGKLSAGVGIIEYSDFQCGFCGQFARDVLPVIDDKFIRPGKLAISFRHFPLEKIHPLARKAAEAAVCADRQERFWEYQKLLFEDPAQLAETRLTEAARAVGIDSTAFEACRARDGRAPVDANVADAGRLGLSGTPSFLLGRLKDGGLLKAERWLIGAQPLSAFETAIEGLISK